MAKSVDSRSRTFWWCVQVKAMLGGPKGKEAVALSDDETIEKCLNEVEAALTAGLNFKGKFNSGLQVLTCPTLLILVLVLKRFLAHDELGMSKASFVSLEQPVLCIPARPQMVHTPPVH